MKSDLLGNFINKNYLMTTDEKIQLYEKIGGFIKCVRECPDQTELQKDFFTLENKVMIVLFSKTQKEIIESTNLLTVSERNRLNSPLIDHIFECVTNTLGRVDEDIISYTAEKNYKDVCDHFTRVPYDELGAIYGAIRGDNVNMYEKYASKSPTGQIWSSMIGQYCAKKDAHKVLSNIDNLSQSILRTAMIHNSKNVIKLILDKHPEYTEIIIMIMTLEELEAVSDETFTLVGIYSKDPDFVVRSLPRNRMLNHRILPTGQEVDSGTVGRTIERTPLPPYPWVASPIGFCSAYGGKCGSRVYPGEGSICYGCRYN